MSPITLILAVHLLGMVIAAGSLAPRLTTSTAALARGFVRVSSEVIRGGRRCLRLLRLPSLTVVILAIVIAVPALRSTAYAAQTTPSGGPAKQQVAAPAEPAPAAPTRETKKPKKKKLKKETSGKTTSGKESAPQRADEAVEAPRSARQDRSKMIAWRMLDGYGWGRDQYQALVELWNRESNWSPTAANPTSAAYGIPQANPGRKMATAGPDWRTNPATQIAWGLNYIKERYGSPIQALAHAHRAGWY